MGRNVSVRMRVHQSPTRIMVAICGTSHMATDQCFDSLGRHLANVIDLWDYWNEGVVPVPFV